MSFTSAIVLEKFLQKHCKITHTLLDLRTTLNTLNLVEVLLEPLIDYGRTMVTVRISRIT